MRNKKYPHHDTIHLIGAILAPYIFKTMRDQEPFDQSRYVFLLKKYKSRKPEKIWDLIDEFTHNPDCRVFLSTDAGGTGLNLQAADCVVNFEMPWNPARINQRIGRVNRIGQKSRCVNVVNLFSIIDNSG